MSEGSHGNTKRTDEQLRRDIQSAFGSTMDRLFNRLTTIEGRLAKLEAPEKAECTTASTSDEPLIVQGEMPFEVYRYLREHNMRLISAELANQIALDGESKGRMALDALRGRGI
jgi:hypothetical protein